MTGYLTTHIELNDVDKYEAKVSKGFLEKLKKEIELIGASETESIALGSTIGIIEQILDGGSF